MVLLQAMAASHQAAQPQEQQQQQQRQQVCLQSLLRQRLRVLQVVLWAHPHLIWGAQWGPYQQQACHCQLGHWQQPTVCCDHQQQQQLLPTVMQQTVLHMLPPLLAQMPPKQRQHQQTLQALWRQQQLAVLGLAAAATHS